MKLSKNPLSMYVYDTVSAAVNGLKTRGYVTDFSLQENCLVCQDARYNAEDFEIVEVYRFEGDSDPADEAVVYAVDGSKGRKGVLVTGYGASAEGLSAEMAKKLSIEKH
ncbi:hypothetical protein LZZ85_15195 [Terrimonas sp. NA20]|uniref:Phosphoribosylpyrophosphate synthetase n=1 Tax=Terrimonas ginsenosidimutans TaxID=2908004 RepID=A0ABS9KTL9_9BACT|nr:hypothetical protein [Terrimonas ginsenosidimutans]MCG2615645.1 hypothetical protein [Terrimonas ginsenosidimutans]